MIVLDVVGAQLKHRRHTDARRGPAQGAGGEHPQRLRLAVAVDDEQRDIRIAWRRGDLAPAGSGRPRRLLPHRSRAHRPRPHSASTDNVGSGSGAQRDSSSGRPNVRPVGTCRTTSGATAVSSPRPSAGGVISAESGPPDNTPGCRTVTTYVLASGSPSPVRCTRGSSNPVARTSGRPSTHTAASLPSSSGATQAST